MPNKLYSDVNSDYLVEGSKDKGYLKNSGKGYGDGKTSGLVNNYSTDNKGTTISKEDKWFEGKKSGVGVSAKR